MHFRAEILKSEKCGHICHIFQVRCGTLGYASNRLIFLQVICLMGRQVFITIQKINQKLLFFHSTLVFIPKRSIYGKLIILHTGEMIKVEKVSKLDLERLLLIFIHSYIGTHIK